MKKAALLFLGILLVTSGCVKKVSGPVVTDHELIRQLYTRFQTHYNTGNTTQLLHLFSAHFVHNGNEKNDVEELLGAGTMEIDLEGLQIRLKGVYAECTFEITIDFGGGSEVMTFTPDEDPLGICFLKRDPSEWRFYGNQEEAEMPASGNVEIQSTPSGASVYLDGADMHATTPVTLTDVSPGTHHIRLYRTRYNEYNETFELNEGDTHVISAVLNKPQPPIPVFTFYSPEDGAHFGNNVITVSGLIQLRDGEGNRLPFDGDRAILTLNGVDRLITVTAGAFNETCSIGSGENRISLRANSSGGDTGVSDGRVVYGDFSAPDIEVTLTWNTPTADLDLHIWNPHGEHCYYGNMTTSDGFLNFDDTEGYGPEVFTSSDATNGIYVVKINCYSLDTDGYSDATLILQLHGETSAYYGPHRFLVADFNGTDQEAWWEVIALMYDGTSAIQPVSDIPETLENSISRQMGQLPAKSGS